MRNLSGILFFLCFCSLNGFGQSFPSYHVDFLKNGTVLKNPLVGGFNSPQFSEVDLNNDNIMDLFVFDRSGNSIITYLNGGTEGEVDYAYAPEFIEQFPLLYDWVLLRDYNGDGVMDIFSSSDIPGISGVIVYDGKYEDGKITFKRLNFWDFSQNIIPFELPAGGFSNLYVSGQDIPAIDDIDGDGDLDIVTFGVNGGYIYLYDNQSIEYGFGLDSLKYTLETSCYGGIYESGLNGCICLSEGPGDCCEGFNANDQADTRHAGSTLLTYFNDDDNDKELVLGDISFKNMVLLENSGTNENAIFSTQDCTFPSNNLSVDIPIFPAAFHIDFNNDGQKDIIASPNAPSNAENYDVGWFYKNMGDNTNPDFEFQQKDLLVEDMLDMGSGSKPTFVDYNQDGLMDLVVGTYSFYLPQGERDPRLFLYENTGTQTSPEFTLISDDYLNFSAFGSNTWTLTPTFGDLDNDGDLDLLVGEESGALFYAENTAGPGNTFTFAPVQYPYADIDVGQVSVPQIVDLNRDGLPDLVIGERNGNLNFMKNIGTSNNPMFHPEEQEAPNIDFLGQVDTRLVGSSTGYSSPLFIDFDGTYRLFCGSQSGFLIAYSNIDNNLEGGFTKDDPTYGGNFRIGERIHPAFHDVDGNGLIDILIGNFRGGLNGFISDMNSGNTVSTQYLGKSTSYKVYPNPAQSEVFISLSNLQRQTANITIYNALGQLLYQETSGQTLNRVDVANFSPGLYLFEITIGAERIVEKIIIE